MVVKVQLAEPRDRRHKKKVTISNIHKHVLYAGEADKELVIKMDGAIYAYFEATVTHNPDTKDGLYNAKDNTKIVLGLRHNNKGW